MQPRKHKNKVNPTKRKDVPKTPWFLTASGQSIHHQLEAAASGTATPTNTTNSSSTFDDSSECCHLSPEVIRFLTTDLVSEHIKAEAKMYVMPTKNKQSVSYTDDPYVSRLRNINETIETNQRTNVEDKDVSAPQQYQPSSSRKEYDSIIILSSDEEDPNA
ncbi:hypothetical protein CFC21_073831 [Triticum aestivum]|uniref:Uncharacterized protein n=2 Tax=Triticum aestivum TaxID=4565 RepID=A0A3B6LT13_WHEAT|nr:hypothetical protein CFC21_073831 [Triticum aestivum]